MRRDVQSIRQVTLSASAVLALAALAATVPLGECRLHVRAEARPALSEAQAVRVIAAAVAAVARDLAGTAPQIVIMAGTPASIILLERADAVMADSPAAPVARLELAARLLDLPPPTC